MLVLGLGDGFKNQEIMECGVLGFQNNELWILVYQSEQIQGSFLIHFKAILIFSIRSIHLNLEMIPISSA